MRGMFFVSVGKMHQCPEYFRSMIQASPKLEERRCVKTQLRIIYKISNTTVLKTGDWVTGQVTKLPLSPLIITLNFFLGRYGKRLILLWGLADVSSFSDVFGILLVGLPHSRRGRHLGRSWWRWWISSSGRRSCRWSGGKGRRSDTCWTVDFFPRLRDSSKKATRAVTSVTQEKSTNSCFERNQNLTYNGIAL